MLELLKLIQLLRIFNVFVTFYSLIRSNKINIFDNTTERREKINNHQKFIVFLLINNFEEISLNPL